jgi:hypothetical protein
LNGRVKRIPIRKQRAPSGWPRASRDQLRPFQAHSRQPGPVNTGCAQGVERCRILAGFRTVFGTHSDNSVRFQTRITSATRLVQQLAYTAGRDTRQPCPPMYRNNVAAGQFECRECKKDRHENGAALAKHASRRPEATHRRRLSAPAMRVRARHRSETPARTRSGTRRQDGDRTSNADRRTAAAGRSDE